MVPGTVARLSRGAGSDVCLRPSLRSSPGHSIMSTSRLTGQDALPLSLPCFSAVKTDAPSLLFSHLKTIGEKSSLEMKQAPLTRGGNTATPLPGRRDPMGGPLLASTPSSSTTSTLSSSSISSISSRSSSSGEERRKGCSEEFFGREEEEGEVVSISIVTIAEESCPSEPFGTVGGHVEVTANESAAKERDGQSKTSHSTQTEEEGEWNGEEDEGREEEEGRKEEEAEEMGEDESDHSALLEEEDEEGRNQCFYCNPSLLL
ncbi:unnamed protein product [Coregonus sp. 'balchen']|nr:unnamed protein product [Coregonus sp. 'balchen']